MGSGFEFVMESITCLRIIEEMAIGIVYIQKPPIWAYPSNTFICPIQGKLCDPQLFFRLFAVGDVSCYGKPRPQPDLR